MEFDLENPLTSLEEHQADTIPTLFASEWDHMPSLNFLHAFISRDLDISFRQEALSSILQAQFSCNFDPFTMYLAVNYMDRFISNQGMPIYSILTFQQGKPWISRLVVLSCMSLAAKMRNTYFSLTDLQGDEGLIFDAQTIQRMELLILSALNWRMRSITPFSFIYFFLSFIQFKDPTSKHSLKDRATEIIFKTHGEVKLLGFKPSLVAASALLWASHELFPLQFPSFRDAIFSCEYVDKANLLSCFEAMQDMVMDWYESMVDSVLSSTKTPISVLDRHCTRTESEKPTSSLAMTTTNASLQ